jgi:hypothetical protein
MLVRPHLVRSDLAEVFVDWAEQFAGYHLYYPSRRRRFRSW